MTIWLPEVVTGAVALAAGAVVVAVVARRGGAVGASRGWAAAAALLAIALLGAAGVVPAGVGDRAGLVAVVIAAPLGLLWVPSRPPRPVQVVVVSLTVVGAAAAMVTLDASVLGVVELVEAVTLLCALWWRFERGDERRPGRGRDRLRWVALGWGCLLLVIIPTAFTPPGGVLIVIGAAVAALAMPAAVVAAYLAPPSLEIRLVAARATGFMIALLVAVALWSGLVAALGLLGVDPGAPGTAAVAAAAVAVVFDPVRRVLDRVVDLLLFGDRIDPVAAAGRLGSELAAADEPAAVLNALRTLLGLPYAAVQDDAGQVLLRSGDDVAETYELPLVASGATVGTLAVGLRPGEAGPSSRDRPVLGIVVPALAQLVRAQTYAGALAESRARVIEAVEEDRSRLRRDLHDGLGPTLTGIGYAADAARNLVAVDPAHASEVLAELRADTGTAIAEVRRLVDGLRPVVLDQLGLVPALRRHAAGLRGPAGTPLTVAVDATDLPPLGPAVELAVFRIVTEALTNVARHAAARTATVTLAAGGAELAVEVRDDGRPGASWQPGIGLTSMRERADQLGGRLEVGSTDTGGRVRLTVPLLDSGSLLSTQS